MTTVEAIIADKKATRVFKLVNLTDSSYTLKTTVNTPNPVHLNSPKTKALQLTSYVSLGQGKGIIETAYVMNAGIINIPDIYIDKEGKWHSTSEKKLEDAQKVGWTLQPGLKKQGYNLVAERKKALALNIHFEFGVLNLDTLLDDPTLTLFVMNHADNRKAPNADAPRPGKNRMWDFAPLEEEVKAAKALDTMDVEAEVKTYIANLRTKKDKSYLYTDDNKSEIDAILHILDIKRRFQNDDYNQKHLAIKGIADGNPGDFLALIQEHFDGLKTEIAVGIRYNVLDMTGDEAVLNTGVEKGKATKRGLIAIKGLDNEAQIKTLSLHFSNDEGRTNYRDFTLLVEAAKTDKK